MVILDYASTDHDHIAVSRAGFLECICFQNHFYGLNRTFPRLKEAIESCRYDMDYGSLISIVVVRSNRYEVWSRLSPGVPVIPKCLLNITASQPSAPARNHLRNFARVIPTDVYFVDAEPSPCRPLFYHGSRPYNALQA